ncbi:Hsp70 family protein [Stappia indica]|uniref:Hsp70 family protein n=1 Tax=Stappia indica TaxID=538381 RepID=UPI001CD37AFC|nr:Hsp70 family protein [Stappia indica]MCA1299975.1 Hsp70 family protein [Stappia indica]
MTTPMPCGIDFGTSNSTASVLGADGESRLLPLEGASAVLPSTLFFSFEDPSVRFGRAAVGAYVEGVEGRLMRSLKSVLGSSTMAEKTTIKAKRWSFSEIIGLYLGQVKRRAEEAAGQPFDKVVLGRPVHFVDDNEDADRRAEGELEAIARASGFDTVAFQFEPIAAALEYERSVRREELAVIIDLGGGTSDFAIVRVSPERRRSPDRREDILANTGVHIGGTDFDRLLSLKKIMPALGYGTPTRNGDRDLPNWAYFELATWHRINFLYAPQVDTRLRGLRQDAARPELVDRLMAVVSERQGHALAGAVEEVKIALSDEAEHRFAFPLPEEDLDIEVLRTDFVAAIERAVGGIETALAGCLQQAGVGAEAISSVFLTGGSASVPFVRERLTRLFPQADVVQGDVFGSVGAGLALDAARKYGTG